MPEAVVIEPRSRGVLDPRLRGDDIGARDGTAFYFDCRLIFSIRFASTAQ